MLSPDKISLNTLNNTVYSNLDHNRNINDNNIEIDYNQPEQNNNLSKDSSKIHQTIHDNAIHEKNIKDKIEYKNNSIKGILAQIAAYFTNRSVSLSENNLPLTIDPSQNFQIGGRNYTGEEIALNVLVDVYFELQEIQAKDPDNIKANLDPDVYFNCVKQLMENGYKETDPTMRSAFLENFGIAMQGLFGQDNPVNNLNDINKIEIVENMNTDNENNENEIYDETELNRFHDLSKRIKALKEDDNSNEKINKEIKLTELNENKNIQL